MTGFIERASCDIYCITDVGRVKSKDKPTAFNSALEAFTLGRMSLNDDVKISAEEAMQVGSPQEEIENNFKLLNSQLGGYLIKAIRNSSPQFFEMLVIDLLTKMGYGQSKVTQCSFAASMLPLIAICS